VDAREFAKRYPTLFHMADGSAWPSIRRHGLLSTKAIVDLYDPPEAERAAILSGRRLASTTLGNADLGEITIRDQLPLKFLDACLKEGVAPQDFLDALNERVYFWLSETRLERLLKARAYRDRAQLVLHIDTRELFEVHGSEVELAPYNTGSAHVPNVPKRGPDVFVPLANYPHDDWRRKRGPSGEAVVELTIPNAVPDIRRFVRRAEVRKWDEDPVAVDLSD
jgi:hypothetical protein